MVSSEEATRVEEEEDTRRVSVDGGTARSSDDHRSRVRSWGHFCRETQVWQWIGSSKANSG